jgi:hypothetical protein
MMKIFTGKKDGGLCADSLLEALDYQKCRHIRCQVEGILIYNGANIIKQMRQYIAAVFH